MAYKGSFELTLLKILVDELWLDANVLLVALAALQLGKQGQPIGGAEINSLGDIEAEVEPAVVRGRQCDNKLARSLYLPSKLT